MLSKRDGSEFRSILRSECSYMLRPEEPQALLFSGGTDSLTVLWTLLELGARPTCYTFRLESVESSDAKASALAAQAWGVDRVEVAVPDAPLPELAAEVGNIARLIGSARKTHVEVMWPLHHVLAAVAPDERQVWTGIQADTLYGSSRSMAIRYGKDPRAFREAREKLVADPGQEGLAQLRALAATFGKGICAPYATAAVRRFMARWSWRELNRPRQKMPAVLGFEDEFRKVPIYRRNDNLQCGSGVREHVARLLACSEVNERGRRSAAKLYADLMEIA